MPESTVTRVVRLVGYECASHEFPLDMDTTIEMFLCLARETDDGLYDEQFLVMPLVSRAIDQQRDLLSGRFVDVDIDDLAKPRVCGHPQAFFIAVNNLVRNAFEHTLDGQGPITILKEHELLVTNQVSSDADGRHPPTEASSSHGYVWVWASFNGCVSAMAGRFRRTLMRHESRPSFVVTTADHNDV